MKVKRFGITKKQQLLKYNMLLVASSLEAFHTDIYIKNIPFYLKFNSFSNNKIIDFHPSIPVLMLIFLGNLYICKMSF